MQEDVMEGVINIFSGIKSPYSEVSVDESISYDR